MEKENAWKHTTVLLNEAVDALLEAIPSADESLACFVDATFGRGGHTKHLLSLLDQKSRVIAFDKDLEAVQAAQTLCQADERFSILHGSFAQLSQLPARSVSGILMDLGVSSPQIDNPERGFSFRFDGPLDMRMDTTHGKSVSQWLETADVKDMTHIIKTYGEERFASSIAKAIDAYRQANGTMTTTSQLAKLVAQTVKTRERGQDPATRTFQAFRIFINQELAELEQALESSLSVLAPNGRLVVISFHSLEDRIVKQFMNKHSRETYDRRNPFALSEPIRFQNVMRIRPSEEEIQNNPRSRSAIMRIATRTDVL